MLFQVESFVLEQDELEDAEPVLEAAKFLLPPNMEGMEAADLRTVDPETQARLEALLEAAGWCKLLHNAINDYWVPTGEKQQKRQKYCDL